MCIAKIKSWWNSRKNKNEVVEEEVDIPVVDDGSESESESESDWNDEVVGEVPGGDIVVEPEDEESEDGGSESEEVVDEPVVEPDESESEEIVEEPVVEPTLDELLWDDVNRMYLDIANDYLGYGLKDYKKISHEMMKQVRDTYTKWSENKWAGLDFDVERVVVLGEDTDGDGDIEIAFRVASVLQLEEYETEFWIDLNIASGLISLKKIR